MMSRPPIHRLAAAAALTAALGITAALAAAQTSGSPERFTALAINMSNVGRTGADHASPTG